MADIFPDSFEQECWQWYQDNPYLHGWFEIRDMDARRGCPGRWHVVRIPRGSGCESVTYWDTIDEVVNHIYEEVQRANDFDESGNG